MDLDEFSDDGFDDLPDNALQELEDNAIQFTQAQASRSATQHQQTGSPEVYWIDEDDDLDTTEVTNDAGVPIGRPVIDNNVPRNDASQGYYIDSRRSIPPPNPQWNPVVDPSKRRPMGQPNQQHLNAAPLNQPMYTSQQFQTQSSNFARAQPSQFARPPLPQNRPALEQSQNRPGDILSALQQRVVALEDQLKAALGEASIVRSNFVKSNEEHAAEVARLNKINAEQLAKQERIAEAAVAAQQNADTELQFLQRDMREVNDRVRRKEPATSASGGLTTPKKASKTWVADGFDELDFALSPSKGQGRNRSSGSVALHVGERTPSKGKRKRPAVDSPVMPLETHTDSFASSNGKPEPAVQQAPIVVAPPPAVPFEVR